MLYAGLMLTEDGPQLVEYNVRFGDPEAQVVLPRLTTDLAELLAAAAAGDLTQAPPPTFDTGACVTVVLACEGYPAAPRTGDVIDGIAEAEAAGATVFCAGVALGPDDDGAGHRRWAGCSPSPARGRPWPRPATTPTGPRA